VLSPAQLASIQNASTARPLHEPARAGIVPLMLTSPARPGSRLAMLQLKALWLCQPISKVAFWAHCLQGLEERPTRVPRDAQVELAAREHCATAYGCSHSSCWKWLSTRVWASTPEPVHSKPWSVGKGLCGAKLNMYSMRDL
jgi:hypothetical protein